MEYVASICSDVGIKKKVNQDAVLVKQAHTDMGEIAFAVVCDGMGGLAQGEVASATVITEMSEWFEKTFPGILYNDFTPDAIRNSWEQEVTSLNQRISEYGRSQGIHLGTTMVAVLLVEDAYYICNVGDSRAYYMHEHLQQMTHDQSYIQREMDMGRMTPEEAKVSNQRNMLLQCIGASEKVFPDFYVGEYQKNSVFILCSDGFRHVITEEEIADAFAPNKLNDKKTIDHNARNLVEVVKTRKEDDNITVVVMHAR
jgi:serine/threonine protein phosphatase PrpC